MLETKTKSQYLENLVTRKLMLLVVLATLPVIGRASNITLQGNFAADDNVQLFSVSLLAPAAIDIHSYGYAGGTTSTGTTVPAGGFDSVLTLFSSSGVFIEDNDDGAGAATDPATGVAGDARITANLATGTYILALTQYDNFSIGNLADGFVESGKPNFTADPSFTIGGACPGNMFRDISGSAGRCRTGNWTVDFSNVATVSPVAAVPEPSALLLAGLGLALVQIFRSRGRKQAALLASIVVGAVASVPAQAQATCPPSTSGPDYCHVSDFLNGQRSLINVTDIELVSVDPNVGPVFHEISTSNSQQTPPQTYNYNLRGLDASQQPVNFSAHMFNQPAAITATTLYSYNGSFALWLQNVASSAGIAAWTPLAPGDEPAVNGGAVADFTQDGFDDIALALADGRILVVSPNSTDPAAQPFGGSFHSSNPITTLNVLQAITAGDFKGDGRKEIAGLTVIPSDQPGGGGLELVIYNVDPTTLAVTPAAPPLVLTSPDSSPQVPVGGAAIARGRFTSKGHDQLAVVYGVPDAPQVRLELIDFDSGTLNAHEVSYINPSEPGTPTSLGGVLQLQAGQFGLPNNTYDQVVFNTGNFHEVFGAEFFAVISADPVSGQLTQHAPLGYDGALGSGCIAPIQVGNFDHRTTSSSDSTQSIPNPNAQVAFMYCNTAGASVMNIYSIDPLTLNVINPPESQLAIPDYSNRDLGYFPWFVATDRQGRSLALGEPTKITIDSSISPNVVIAAPPMHVDFISPDPLSGVKRQLFNLSVVPDSFNTAYEQEQTGNTSTTTTNKTSWSFGATESANASLTVGDPDAGEGLKASDTLTAAQNLKGASEQTFGSFSGSSFSVGTTTGLGDQVYFTDSQFNIWIYPVIGKTVCPSTKPNCQPNEKVPLTIQFSAPNGQAASISSPGASLPWYQPPWEPGNVFSYPANAAQLKAIFPNLTPLTTPTEFASTSGSVTEEAKWSGQNQSGTTASFDQDYSFDNNFSVNGAIGFAGISVGAGASLDLSGSYGLSTLTQTSNQIGSSTGLKISVPGTFANFANYGYVVSPAIMGTVASENVVDSPPNTADNTSVQTFGRMYAMFTVDPLDASRGAGAWWKQAYRSAPDVALNHPKRYTFTATSLSGAPPSNCLAIGGTSSQYDCVSINAPTPSNPLGDDFHVMRGFFISRANAQNQNFQNQGPQLETSKAGEVLNLSARVYNYSLADMPADTEVHTSFYYMLWDTGNAAPVDPNGASTLISDVVTKEPICASQPGETRTGPICGFSTSSDQLNWTLVGTQFNTGDATKFSNIRGGNVSLLFWVVVWMQNSNGLVTELPDHGLTGEPPVFASWVDAANFECPDTSSCYSNNLGVYPSPFYVGSPSFGATPNPVPVSASVNLGKLDLSASTAALTAKVTASVTVSAQDADAGTMSVNFYKGDPKQGGQLFDVERIARISQGSNYKVSASYRPTTCGIHDLFVVINQGQSNEVVRRAQPLRVACNAF